MLSSGRAAEQDDRFDPTAVRCVGLIAALHKRRVASAVREVVAWFEAREVRPLLFADQARALSLPHLGAAGSDLPDAADMLLAMGGDGTFLAAARVGAPRGKPILGINLGGFGFLAAVPQAGMLDSLAEVMAGRMRVEERMMAAARVLRLDAEVGSFIALNDIVIGKGAFSRLLHFQTSISGEPLSHFPADGMIIATPTGSTAYSLAAGGPVVSPAVRALIITPICPHALSARTLVVPPECVIEITLPDPGEEEVILTADGQEGLALRPGDRVEVREASFSARLICLEGTSFYAKLRGKLGWMGPR